jgi:hypothetical protein
MELLLDRGTDVNSRASTPDKTSALELATDKKDTKAIECLLARGANPNIGRPIIGALNQQAPPKLQLAFLKLLVDRGCDVNRLFDLYGDSTNQFTALDWASDPDVIDYLKTVGAKTSDELGQSQQTARPADELTEVVQFFDETFGEVDERALVEIVPSGHPVAINVIRPKGDRQHLTLFTTGLSSQRMHVPDDLSEFAFAELFIQLPGDWLLTSGDPKWSWPTEWLRKVAQYPHANNVGLGGPVTIIANGEPPEPLAPNTDFTSLLLVAEKSFKRRDGNLVQLYRVAPIYSDERDLEIREGAPALMRAFDRQSVPFIVDLQRPSVAAGH